MFSSHTWHLPLTQGLLAHEPAVLPPCDTHPVGPIPFPACPTGHVQVTPDRPGIENNY